MLEHASIAIQLMNGEKIPNPGYYNKRAICNFHGIERISVNNWTSRGVSHLFTNKLINNGVNWDWLNYGTLPVFKTYLGQNPKSLTFPLKNAVNPDIIRCSEKHVYKIGRTTLDGKEVKVQYLDNNLSIIGEKHDPELLKKLWEECKIVAMREYREFNDWLNQSWVFDTAGAVNYATVHFMNDRNLRKPEFFTNLLDAEAMAIQPSANMFLKAV